MLQQDYQDGLLGPEDCESGGETLITAFVTGRVRLEIGLPKYHFTWSFPQGVYSTAGFRCRYAFLAFRKPRGTAIGVPWGFRF